MIRAAMAALAGLLGALPAGAQSVPVFEDRLGFAVTGAMPDGRLIVENDDAAFLCHTDTGAVPGIVALRRCAAILGPEEAAILAQRLRETAGTAEGFLDAIALMPPWRLAEGIEQALRMAGCTIDFSHSDLDLLTRTAAALAHDTAYDGPLDGPLIDGLAERLAPVTERLVAEGRVIVDQERQLASLAECG